MSFSELGAVMSEARARGYTLSVRKNPDAVADQWMAWACRATVSGVAMGRVVAQGSTPLDAARIALERLPTTSDRDGSTPLLLQG